MNLGVDVLVILVYLAFLSQDVLDLTHAHVFEAFKVFNTTLCYANVNMHLIVVLFKLHDSLLLFF